MSLLSVIVPVYNGDRYIKETINYLQKSQHENLEIIIVNDGSTDNSEQIVKEIIKEDRRVVLYNRKNGGVVSARNYGCEMATGEYICFADQDDIIKPFMYKKLVERLEEDDSDMAMCSSGRSINGNESIFECQKNGLYEGEEVKKNLLYPILFNGYDVPYDMEKDNRYPHIWTCVFRKKFWDKCNLKFRAYINFEDDLLVKVEALSKASRVSTIAEVGYLWRVNLQSESYAHHYIKNIGEKQEACYRDMEAGLLEAGVDGKVLDLFKQVTYCKQYVDAVHYLSSPEIKVNRKFLREYFRDNIYSRDFENAIKGRKYLKKGRIKPSILLPLLEKKKEVICYDTEILLDKILLLTLHSQTLTKLERKLKQNK